jgi:hypothetical protein
MQLDESAGFLAKGSPFELCIINPLPARFLDFAIREGGKILPIVGDSNAGADILLRECQTYASAHDINCLTITVGASVAKGDTIIEAIAQKIGLPAHINSYLDFFGSLSTRIIEDGYQLILIDGASHMSQKGLNELVDMLVRMREQSVDDGKNHSCPLIVWHALPNWESEYSSRNDSPPLKYFWKSIYLPIAEQKCSIEKITAAFPSLGAAVAAAGETAWDLVISATDGQLGIIDVLNSSLQSLPSSDIPLFALSALLTLTHGVKMQPALKVSVAPKRTTSTMVPSPQGEFAPPRSIKSCSNPSKKRAMRKKRRSTV